jgi:hypothetical protein
METMSKFKVDNEIVRVQGFTGYAPKFYKAIVLEDYKFKDAYGSFTSIVDGYWELVKPKWTIYNNDKAWEDLSDKQKGKLLLAAHAKIRFTCNELDVFGDVAFNNEGVIYKAQYIEPVKPELTMAEIFSNDWKSCQLGITAKMSEQMITKGWNKSCK